jgi:serine/threonine protein kinase
VSDKWLEAKTIPDLQDLPRGAMVGEYWIRRKIAEGASGGIYAAIHPVIGRKVAIKVLRAELVSNEEAVGRFIQEARAACQVRHPGIVEIFGFGQLPDGRHYIVMEYLPGRPLRDRMTEQKRLSLAQALPILRGICLPLAACHKVNIVHRDLKPENVFLLEPETPGESNSSLRGVKILDLGMAKLLDAAAAIPGASEHTMIELREGASAEQQERGELTRIGATMGTPRYMAPEQCLGKAVDGRTDIYALGVIMYELLTGAPPFDAPDPYDLMRMHVQAPVPAPAPAAADSADANGGIDGRAERLMLECLAKDPNDRPQTMKDVVARLDACAPTGESTDRIRRARAATGSRLLWILVGAGLVLALSAAGFWLLR